MGGNSARGSAKGHPEREESGIRGFLDSTTGAERDGVVRCPRECVTSEPVCVQKNGEALAEACFASAVVGQEGSSRASRSPLARDANSPHWGEGALSLSIAFAWLTGRGAFVTRRGRWRDLCTVRAMISTTTWQGWKSARGVISFLAVGALLAACNRHEIAVGEDKTRSQPAGSSMPTGGGVDEKGVTPRSDQKMVPGLDQGHTPGSADTTVPLHPGLPPLDDAGAAARPPPKIGQ